LTVGETNNVLPVPAIVVVEPHEPVPHSNVLLPVTPPVAVKVVEPPVQILPVPPMLVGAVGCVLTVIVNVAQVVLTVLHTPVP